MPPCLMADKPINCRKRNLVYETSCLGWKNNEGRVTFTYVGETARSSRERLDEHTGDLGRA